jgi:hypothetical protein
MTGGSQFIPLGNRNSCLATLATEQRLMEKCNSLKFDGLCFTSTESPILQTFRQQTLPQANSCIITKVLYSVHNKSLDFSWAKWILPPPSQTISMRTILVLSHPIPRISYVIYVCIIIFILRATFSAHLIHLDLNSLMTSVTSDTKIVRTKFVNWLIFMSVSLPLSVLHFRKNKNQYRTGFIRSAV